MEWLPSFCNAPHRNYSVAGFRQESICKLSEFDAYWFLVAVDSKLVFESDGFFVSPQSKAKEQIFWDWGKGKNPRPLNLWLEPIITIGAVARLAKEFGWPIEQLGMQSKTWAFDLVCYDKRGEEYVVCEVKKTSKEIASLLAVMSSYCVQQPLAQAPANGKERNAYRKVQGVRRSWPRVFWALGPGDAGSAFTVRRDNDPDRFWLNDVGKSALMYQGA